MPTVQIKLELKVLAWGMMGHRGLPEFHKVPRGQAVNASKVLARRQLYDAVEEGNGPPTKVKLMPEPRHATKHFLMSLSMSGRPKGVLLVVFCKKFLNGNEICFIRNRENVRLLKFIANERLLLLSQAYRIVICRKIFWGT